MTELWIKFPLLIGNLSLARVKLYGQVSIIADRNLELMAASVMIERGIDGCWFE